MIVATIKYSGTFVDRPNTTRIRVDGTQVATEKLLPNGKTEKISALDLYRLFKSKRSYTTLNIEVEDQLPMDLFETWFKLKYLKGSSIYERIISIDYTEE